MKVNFENEAKDLITKLRSADGYLECEKLIIGFTEKYLVDGKLPQDMGATLKKLLNYIQELVATGKNSTDCINFGYATGYLTTLVESPHWYSWIDTSMVL